MATNNASAGEASVTIDGKTYNIAGKGSYRVSGIARTALYGQDGFHGFKGMPLGGKISWQGRDGSAVAIAALNETVDATVVLSLINGKTIIGRNMGRVGEAPIEVDTEEGTFDMEFEGPDVVEA